MFIKENTVYRKLTLSGKHDCVSIVFAQSQSERSVVQKVPTPKFRKDHERVSVSSISLCHLSRTRGNGASRDEIYQARPKPFSELDLKHTHIHTNRRQRRKSCDSNADARQIATRGRKIHDARTSGAGRPAGNFSGRRGLIFEK